MVTIRDVSAAAVSPTTVSRVVNGRDVAWCARLCDTLEQLDIFTSSASHRPTSPVTLAGNILMHEAETMAGVMMAQAVNFGAPVIAGSVGSTADMRTLQHLSGPIERAIINARVYDYAVGSRGGIPASPTADSRSCHGGGLA